MKSKSFSPMGSLHPVLFFAAMYMITLLFAVFICSSLFYSCNANPSNAGAQNHKHLPGDPANAVALR